jgi:glycosyltransferase involved in cell wall biosynthesis
LLLLRRNLALMHEAMALGTPIIGAGAGTGVIEAGLLWEDADAGLLAATVERLRRDAALRTRLRERGFAQLMCSPPYAGAAVNRGASA